MAKICWTKARFVKSCVKSSDYPKLLDPHGNPLLEIAIAGRSNVGKSSLINDLFGIKNLAKVSSTPGKTQLLNFFVIDDHFAFVDLPGYGFAHVPESLKKAWGPMIQRYLEKRASLQLIIFLLDIRRIPNADDLQFLEWAHFQKKPILLVLTKVDKVTTSEKTAQTKKILAALPDGIVDPLCYSIKTHGGKFELQKILQHFLETQ